MGGRGRAFTYFFPAALRIWHIKSHGSAGAVGFGVSTLPCSPGLGFVRVVLRVWRPVGFCVASFGFVEAPFSFAAISTGGGGIALIARLATSSNAGEKPA